MKIEIEGLNRLQYLIEKLGDDREEPIPSDTILLEDLLNREFMGRYTDIESVEVFFSQSPWDPQKEEDFHEIPDEELDTYVALHTQFVNWKEMIGRALEAYIEEYRNDER